MDRGLNKAAMDGSVPSLLQLLKEDELILDRYISGPNLDTPLHVAAMLGHSEFVSKLISLKPEPAREVDSQRSTPLHQAVAKGYVEIVTSLLIVYPGASSVLDKYGRNPVQVAALKGKVEVLELLVQADAAAARSVHNRTGETVLHLCAKNGKLESVMAIVGMFDVDDEFIDWKDKDGNSALHLAAAYEQFEVGNLERQFPDMIVDLADGGRNSDCHHGLRGRTEPTSRCLDGQPRQLNCALSLSELPKPCRSPIYKFTRKKPMVLNTRKLRYKLKSVSPIIELPARCVVFVYTGSQSCDHHQRGPHSLQPAILPPEMLPPIVCS